ncbi:MAG: SDR family oxidoreductase [Gemmatimonadetes bacterium]|nr:SDR family oxidoreductase [Gemmatimonadota bacterium]
MIFQDNLLEGQVALVTGGGTGIGFGIASELARYGAAVAIASRSPDHLTPALDKLQAAGATALGIETNVREPESIKAAVTKTVEEWGRIDILVNNAAGNFYAQSAGLSPNGWKAVVETDLYGTFYGSQAVHPIMREQGGGKIISTSMTLHYRGWPLMAHATAAKAGVDALTRTLAVEWAQDNITVNAVAPGPIMTEGAYKAFGSPEGKEADAMGIDERLKKQIPLGRLGTPADIGNMVVYLASPAGSWITGSIIVIDGGSWLSKF